jgi:hypothetical protein
VRPWEYGQIDAYEWTEAMDVQRAWHDGLAEADQEAAIFRGHKAS